MKVLISPEAIWRNLKSDGEGTASHRSSRFKSQGVPGSGELKGGAKAICPQHRKVRGAPSETAVNHFLETRSQCDLIVGRAKPTFRLVEARNQC